MIEPVTPSATSVSPRTAPSALPRKAVSPFYGRYLEQQAVMIRASAEAAGENGDEAVWQFATAEQGRPLMLLQPDNSEWIDKPTNLRGVSMAMIQGATFGWGDEALGALHAQLTGADARDGIDNYRKEYESWAKEHGKTSFVAEIAGGFLTGGLFGGAEAGIGRAALRAGAAGAVAGAGYTDGTVGERAQGAIMGTVLGGALGATFGLGSRFIAPLFKPVTEAVTRAVGRTIAPLDRKFGLTLEGQAREHLVNVLEGIDPDELIARADAMRVEGVSPTLLDIGGEGVLGLAKDVFSQLSLAKRTALEAIAQRQTGQDARLMAGAFGEVFKRQRWGLANAYEIADELRAHGLKFSEPYYKDAYSQVVKITPAMREALSDPHIRMAWNLGAQDVAAQDIAKVANPALKWHGLSVQNLEATLERAAIMPKNPSPELAARLKTIGITGAGGDELPIRGIDQLKRTLDQVVKAGLRGDKPTITKQRASVLRDLSDVLVDGARKQVVAYDKALTIYGGFRGSEEAIKLGQDAFRKPPGLIDREIRKLAPNERDFYRIGYAQKLYERLSTPAYLNDAAKFFGNHLFEESGKSVRAFGTQRTLRAARSIEAQRVTAMFPDAPEVARGFLRLLAGESRVSYSTKRAFSIPRTTLKKLEQSTEGQVPPVRGTLGVTFLSAGRQTVVQSRNAFSAEMSDELAHQLTKGLRKPDELAALIEGLRHAVTAPANRASVRARVVTTLGRFGGQAGAAQR